MNIDKIWINFSVDVLLVLVMAGGALVAWFAFTGGAQWPPDRATLIFLVSTIGGTAAIYQLSRNIKQNRIDKAFGFMERWNDVEFQKKRDKIDEDAKKLLMNFFEEMSLAIESRNADEEVLRRYFRFVAITAWREKEEWVKEIREKAEFAFIETETMVERWRKKKPA